jgi:CDP-diacylglycerol---serine O-phosphatidyltransferase
LKPPRRAAYALPTLFTSGNLFLGFVAILQTFQAALQVQSGDFHYNPHFAFAAKSLGFAVLFDGIDGFIARLTNTVSDFGREMDSLADVITFGIAPSVLLFVWGVLFVAIPPEGDQMSHLLRAGYVVSFFFLLCGAVRLARFNVQANPTPKNPGKPDRKYFVGMPIPAGAGFVAAVVFLDPSPVRAPLTSVAWLITVVVLSLLMVSTWRYPSFKKVNMAKPHATIAVLVVGIGALLISQWPQPVLMTAAITYVSSGICLRLGGVFRRWRKTRATSSLPEHQIG